MKRSHPVFGLVASSLLAVACGGPLTYQLQGTPKAVGADASLQATVYKGEHETKIVLDARNLPPPARVTADAKFFVVWARKDSNATWQRAGNIVYDDSARTGVFKGSFPETGFDLEVSAEKEESAASPSPDIVFAQHVGAS